MARLLLKKFLFASAALFFVATLTFAMTKALPGDPFRQEQAMPKEIYDALRDHYGLNDPWPIQYMNYMKQWAMFDLGPSFVYKGRSVAEMIIQGVPISALLGIEALLFAVPFGILTGVFAATKHNRWQDSALTLLTVIGISVPSFILATLLQYFLAVKLEILPIARWGTLAQTILPALSLAALPTAFIARLTRSKMINELNQDYIRTARAKGLSECTVIVRHALRNVMITILSYLGPLSVNIMTGSFIIEKIYSIPGLGYWFVMAILNRDYTLISGITVFYCAVLLLIAFVIDAVCVLLDPRISRPGYSL